jgi:CheY-like chemotaxis protein
LDAASNGPQGYPETASIEPNKALVTILVVEDNWVARQIVKATLESRGYSVLLAANGRSAMEIMSSGGCDLVLLDLMLPDVEGATLLERLRRLPGGEQIPILAFSAFVSRLEDLRKMGARFNAYIAKPVEPEALIEIVEENLRHPTPAPSPALYVL